MNLQEIQLGPTRTVAGIQYPLVFPCEVEAGCGMQKGWKSAAEGCQTQVAVPPEFGGKAGMGLSPEALFQQALVNCFVATLQVYASYSKLQFEFLQAQSRLVVDLDEQNRPMMKSLWVDVEIRGGSNPDRIQALAEKAIRSGFVLNSVKTELHFQVRCV